METFHLISSLGFSAAVAKRSGQHVEPVPGPRGPGEAMGRGCGAVGSVGDSAVPTAPWVTAVRGKGCSAVGHRLAAPVMETVKHLSTVQREFKGKF